MTSKACSSTVWALSGSGFGDSVSMYGLAIRSTHAHSLISTTWQEDSLGRYAMFLSSSASWNINCSVGFNLITPSTDFSGPLCRKLEPAWPHWLLLEPWYKPPWPYNSPSCMPTKLHVNDAKFCGLRVAKLPWLQHLLWIAGQLNPEVHFLRQSFWSREPLWLYMLRYTHFNRTFPCGCVFLSWSFQWVWSCLPIFWVWSVNLFNNYHNFVPGICPVNT